MSHIAAEVWRRLEQSSPAGDQLVARQGTPDLTERLLAAVDSQRRRHLLIPLEQADDAAHDATSRGLTVATRELSVRSRDIARYLDIECRDVPGYPIFDFIGYELAQELARAERQPAEITRRVLAKWRRFWGQVPRSLLSREELMGLFGELWFLHVWLIPHVGLIEAMQRWRGPFGARHDFEWTGKSTEAKATSSTRGRIFRINGVDQLLPPEGGGLLLFGMRLREEAGATNSLSSLVARVREEMAEDADAMSRYEMALLQAGYSPVHDEEYAKLHLRIVEERLFSVTADFPVLTSQSVIGGLPPAIERVEYEINLNAYDHLCVARIPADAAVHLR